METKHGRKILLGIAGAYALLFSACSGEKNILGGGAETAQANRAVIEGGAAKKQGEKTESSSDAACLLHEGTWTLTLADKTLHTQIRSHEHKEGEESHDHDHEHESEHEHEHEPAHEHQHLDPESIFKFLSVSKQSWNKIKGEANQLPGMWQADLSSGSLSRGKVFESGTIPQSMRLEFSENLDQMRFGVILIEPKSKKSLWCVVKTPVDVEEKTDHTFELHIEEDVEGSFTGTEPKEETDDHKGHHH